MADRNQLLNDAEAGMRAALDGRQANIWTAAPGIVIDVNMADNTLSVQVAIKAQVENPDGSIELVNIPPLVKVPIQWPKAGGFALTLPVKPDDEVLVIFASRCIDAWWQSGGIQRAMEARMHDLSDGFAIVGISSVPNALVNVSTTEAQLRTEDGSTYLSITADNKIKMVASAGIEVTGNMTVLGMLKAGASVPLEVGLATHVHTSAAPGNPTSAPTPGT